MKYVVLVGDGMADRPLEELDGRTPLEAAHTPQLDFLARHGRMFLVHTIPEGFAPGSDVANLNVLGYDPAKHYTGRAGLEAASLGLYLRPQDVAFRCNLVTVAEDEAGVLRLVDFSAGHISTEEARKLIEDLAVQLGTSSIKFYPGISYRHIMVWSNGTDRVSCTPPHDIAGQPVAEHLPRGRGRQMLLELMEEARQVLEEHPINQKRRRLGLQPANAIWLWGAGRLPNLPKFRERFGLEGAIISAVDLLKGIGKLVGFEVVEVPGATGYLDTNYAGKVAAALQQLESKDLVYLHVEAPDEAGHQGEVELKLQAIEDFDSRVVGPILAGLRRFGEYRIMVLPDHATPIRVRTHTAEPVPAVIYQAKGGAGQKAPGFCEAAAARYGERVARGFQLMEAFLAED